MPAPSLVDSCTKACIKNIRSLIDVGSFEYWQIKTVLQRVESPEQLHQIELNSPQLLGEDAELWQSFISRHIPNWRTKNYKPKNPKKWYEVYCKYKKEQQEEIARDEEILRASMMGLKAARETNVSKIVDLKMLPKLPRDPRMIANNGGVPIKKGFRKEAPATLNWTSGSKTKMTDGKSVLTRARREAKEISQMGRLAKPTHRLSGALGQVRKAPEGMVKEYKTASQPAIKILSRKKQPQTLASFSGGVTGPSLEERERRLRAAMAGGSGSKRDASGDVKHTYVGSSDDDLDDFIENDEEIDDLFDEAPKPKSRPVSSSTASRPPPSRPVTSRPSQQSSSPPAPSSRPKPKPSDVISSLISKPRPGGASSPPPSRGRASSPPKTGTGQRPMAPKRKEVDIFNRGPKKRRIG
ncbi:hypothetical protein ONS96_002651 [Cadophora gregata f. sp. sojae]|nr:hypothetical protein ONS96_002651 [Cadophora gregata f. sp. sojae]